MILEGYIFRKCLFNTLLVLLAFVTLFAVFTTLGELDSLGKGNFTMLSMLIYILALVPNFTYMLLPLAVLIGVMVGMLGLVSYSEYAIIRTSGMSLKKITKILALFGILFTIITLLFGEVLAPKADHFAKAYKITKLKKVVSTSLQSGIWSKDGDNTFVNIKQIMPDNTILGINVYYYSESLQLCKYLNANEGSYDKQHKFWILKDAIIYHYNDKNISTDKKDVINWQTSIEPSYFNALVVSPEEMSALELIKYIKHLKKNNQSVRRYEIAFWGKLIYPISCLSMAILAIAFIPNNRRNINLGTRLFFGIIVGVSFFFFTKLVGYLTVLFSWNPLISSTGPTLLLFIIGAYFVYKRDN